MERALTASFFSPKVLLKAVGPLETPWGPTVAQELQHGRRQTFAEHTLRALTQFEKHFASGPMPKTMSADHYRLALALHEAGTHSARRGFGRGDPLVQTGQLLDGVRDQLGLTEDGLRVLKALTTTDALTSYLRGRDVEDTVTDLRRAGDTIGLDAQGFLRALTPMYQSDIAAHTVAAGLPAPFLDELFAGHTPTWDAGLQRLKMSPKLERRWTELDAAVRNGDHFSRPRATKPAQSGSRTAEELGRLGTVQRRVVDEVRRSAASQAEEGLADLHRKAQRLGYSAADVAEVLAFIKDKSRLNLYFHPDHLTADGRTTVVDSLRAHGRAMNQYETGFTTASMGPGRRAAKEQTLFNQRFSATLVPAERPIYAALNAEGPVVTGAQTFYGSCYLELKPHVKARASLTHRNSSSCVFDELATTDNIAHLLAHRDLPDGYLKRIFDHALGRRGSHPELKRYVEAQIFGGIDFKRDLAAVVGAKKYRGTGVERSLQALADQYGVPLRWCSDPVPR